MIRRSDEHTDQLPGPDHHNLLFFAWSCNFIPAEFFRDVSANTGWQKVGYDCNRLIYEELRLGRFGNQYQTIDGDHPYAPSGVDVTVMLKTCRPVFAVQLNQSVRGQWYNGPGLTAD